MLVSELTFVSDTQIAPPRTSCNLLYWGLILAIRMETLLQGSDLIVMQKHLVREFNKSFIFK